MDELKKRVKSPHDMITDGVLAYGVNVGRFVFEEGFTVYVIYRQGFPLQKGTMYTTAG